MKQSSLLRVGSATVISFLLLSVQWAVLNGFRQASALSQSVIINEWSQGESGRREWIELFVVDAGVDLTGWDLGDESAGDLQFSNADLWQNIPAGTLIVIYNGSDRDGLLPPDDLDISDWTLIVSSKDTSLFQGSWPSFSNSNPADFPQLRDESDIIIHQLSFLLDDADKAPAGGESVHFMGGSADGVENSVNWEKKDAIDASPADGNSDLNQAWAASLRVSATPNTPTLTLIPATATPTPATSTPSPPASASKIIIEKAYPDGLAENDADEAILLRNVGAEAVNLVGWGLSDDPGNPLKMTLPSGAILPPNEKLWLTKNAEAFRAQFGFPADYEVGNTQLSQSQQLVGPWPGFANSGDEMILANSSGEIVDALVYEGGDTVALSGIGHWDGESLLFYGVGAAEGQLFFRKIDPETGYPLDQTNGRSDWGQDPDDPILGRQVQYPGWDVEQFFTPATVQETATLTIAVAPDNAFEAISNLISKAQSSIQIETHTFESHELLEQLKMAVERGVKVEILLEGGPPGGLQDPQRWNCYALELAGGNCYVMQNDSTNHIFDRYTFMHAKFMIIDDRYAAVSSDNLSPNSWPADEKADGTFGRRGVVLITDATSVINQLGTIFAADLDQANHQDITRWQPLQTIQGFPIETYQIPEPVNATTYTVAYSEPFETRGEMGFEIIQAPENYLNPTAGLFNLLDSAGAGDTVLVQQQYERLYWGETDASNLRLNSYVQAARRGTQVKVMLDSFFDDEDHPASNKATCQWLNQLADDEKLDLACRTGNPTGLGIHNKMVLVQVSGQGFVHVGSINGSEQSAKANREVALQVASNEAYDHLSALFNRDFPSQLYLPMVTHEQNGAILRPLISEVLYNPFGATDDAEFIEIVNPSNRPIDISGFSLSDAVTAADYADLRRFPDGTILPAKGVLVVTQQAAAFEAQFLVKADFEILDSDPAIPELIDEPAWGDPSTFLRLGNTGDVVYLRDQADLPVDVLVYGEFEAEGHPTCAAVTLAGASLRRIDIQVDTNSCSDFEEWGSPTPGQVP